MGARQSSRQEITSGAEGGAAIYGLAVLVGAALVFQVQPIAGKFLLPVFGGGEAVWTTCMFFFQSMLLAGYGYAHWLTSSLAPRGQAALHAALLMLSAFLLPLGFAIEQPAAGDDRPNTLIWIALLSTIGFPFVMLASTAPLMQRWLSIIRPARSPYRLYALSNFGALLALLTYPLLVEPNLTLDAQTRAWSAAYALFLLLSLLACRLLWLRHETAQPLTANHGRHVGFGSRIDALLTVVFSAGGVVMLLAVTSLVTRNVAPIPFLWIAPLMVYLLTFIVCFSGSRGYDRPVWASLFVVSACLIAILEFFGAPATVPVVLIAGLLVLLCSCMVCHGELYRLRPAPRYLAKYYLLVATGGAFGGAFVSIAAPAVFDSYWESLIGVYLIYLAFGAGVFREMHRTGGSRTHRSAPQARLDFWAGRLFAVGWTIGAFIYPAVVFLIAMSLPRYDIESSRNFYGVLKVRDVHDDGPPQRRLVDGTTIHGIQLLEPRRRSEPLSYYGKQSGIGHVMSHIDRPPDGLRIGAVGLGIGTIATYAAPGDEIRFYELNPAVVDLAREHFSFLRETRASVDLIIGDGRVSLERELAENGGRDYDLLVIDAFTSDAIPVHLLTTEAFRVYSFHLKPGGVLAIHVTNSYVDLVPVVADVAAALGKHAVHLRSPAAGDGTFAADWVVLTEGTAFTRGTAEGLETIPLMARPSTRAWTDDYSDLLRTLRR